MGRFLETDMDLCGLEAVAPPALAFLQQLSLFQRRLASKPLSQGALGDSWARGCDEGSRKRWGGGDLTAICCTSHHCDSG